MESKSKRCPGTNMDEPGEHVAMSNNDKQQDVFVEADDISVNDVVLGRGSRIAGYPGNENFRRLVSQYRHEYNTTKRMEKHTVSAKVVQHIASLTPPGRFLTMMIQCNDDDDNGDTAQEPQDYGTGEVVYYTLTPWVRSVEKVSQALREKPKMSVFQKHQAPPVSMETAFTSSSSTLKMKKKKKAELRPTPAKKKKNAKKKTTVPLAAPVVVTLEEETFKKNRFGRTIRIKTVVQKDTKQPPNMPAPRRVTDPWRSPPFSLKQQEDVDDDYDDDIIEKTPSSTKEEHQEPSVETLSNQSAAAAKEVVSFDDEDEEDDIMSITPNTDTNTAPPSDKDVDYTSWSFYQHQQKQEQDKDLPPFFTEGWMLGAAAAASDLNSEQLQLDVSCSFPSYYVMSDVATIGTSKRVGAKKNEKKIKTTLRSLALPSSPNTVIMDDSTFLGKEEEEPCEFQPRRSLFAAVEQPQVQQPAGSNISTTKDDCTFIFSLHDDNINHSRRQEEEEEEDDDDDKLWPLPLLDTVNMEEHDDAARILGLSGSYFIKDPIQMDLKRLLFSAGDNDHMDHYHHHHDSGVGGGSTITETENWFFQYWGTDHQGTTISTNQAGATMTE